MIASACCLVVALVIQVPAPDSAVREADALRRQEKGILDREAARLTSLADGLAARGEKDAAAEVRRDLPTPPSPDGASRFLPLPELVPSRGKGRGKGLANVPSGGPGNTSAPWKSERDAILATTATELFSLATRAATANPHHYALADACLRAVIARQPDHAEARRLLGFVPHDGGWATPYAVRKIRDGMTLDATFGWVKSSWVPHLEKGEYPSRAGLARGKEVWIPAEEADAERADWNSAWEITTEHFQITTNVPLAKAIAFGRHLETLHELFQSLFADVIGEHLPEAQRFRSKTLVGEKPDAPHRVSYFATREQFIDHLRARQPDIGGSLGLYLPADRGRRGRAYFFLDEGGEIEVTATLYHEGSHQLLFESGIASPSAYEANVGNYWVFEGLGTYFETMTIEPDGPVRIGGLVGPRIKEAQKNLVENGLMVPLKTFVSLDKTGFSGDERRYLHYQQAIALTTFLMQGRDGAYREGFLDYVKSACQGRLKGMTGRSLESRVGKPYAEIEAEFLDYLKGKGPE